VPPAIGQLSQDAGGCAFFEIALGFVHNGGGGRSDACDVLQKEEPRTAIVGNVENVEEQAAAFAIKARTLARQTEVLAREARSNSVHSASPASSVEGGEVGPDRSVVQAAFFAPCCQDSGRVGFPFHVADGAQRDAHVTEPGSQSFAKHPHASADFDGV
jgi:hypothetical protein